MNDKAKRILEIHILDFLPSELMMLNFHVRTLLHTPFFIISVLGSGVSFSFLKAFSFAGDASGSEAFWVYSTIASLWAATTLATGLIGYQRFQGTFPYLLLSPQGIPAVFVPLIVSAAFLGLVLGVPVSLLFSFLWFHQVVVRPVYLLAILLATLACAASALCFSALYLLTRRASIYEGLILTGVWLISGIVVPLSNFSEPVQLLFCIHPLTVAVKILAAVSAQELVLLCIAACALSICFAIVGSKVVAASFVRARREGDFS